MRKSLLFMIMLLLIFPSIFLIHLFSAASTSTSLEYVLSQRRSFHGWEASWDKSIPINNDLMKAICNSAFSSGFNLSGIQLYWANSTACYLYTQTTNSFAVQISADVRAQLASDVNQPIDNAPCIITIVWDNKTEQSKLEAYRKAGIIVQNLYIVAVRNNLGGCCIGAGIYYENVTTSIQEHLNLTANLKPTYFFPIGFLKEGVSYPTGDLQETTGNLPSPLESNIDILDVFNQKKDLATEWSDFLPQQKLSNMLWSMYGYSLLGTGHRTVPSSHGVYPFQIYVCNASGIYNYTASTHSLNQIDSTDKRAIITAHAEAPPYLKNAPTLLVVCWDSLATGPWGSYNASDSDSGGRFINTNAGCCFQNLYLSANIWNASISDVIYTTNYETLRNDIANPLPSHVYPMYIVGIGEPSRTHTYIFPVFADSKTFHITIETNSTISASTFSFSKEDRLISFNITGASDTDGFCNVTIPDELLGGPYTILFDDPPVTLYPTWTQNATHSFLYFTYNHSAYTIKIIGTTVIPEFPAFTILQLFMITSLVAVILVKTIRSRNQLN